MGRVCSVLMPVVTLQSKKFQGDWPSGRTLIKAWSLVFAPNVLVCKVAPLVKVRFLPYHVTWSHRLKIAVFKSCSNSPNLGRVCSVLMPVVTLQSFKMIGRPEVRKLRNWGVVHDLAPM